MLRRCRRLRCRRSPLTGNRRSSRLRSSCCRRRTPRRGRDGHHRMAGRSLPGNRRRRRCCRRHIPRRHRRGHSRTTRERRPGHRRDWRIEILADRRRHCCNPLLRSVSRKRARRMPVVGTQQQSSSYQPRFTKQRGNARGIHHPLAELRTAAAVSAPAAAPDRSDLPAPADVQSAGCVVANSLGWTAIFPKVLDHREATYATVEGAMLLGAAYGHRNAVM